MKKIEPYSRNWEQEANALARDFAPKIYPCKKCFHPVVHGYCCTFCNDSDPEREADLENLPLDNGEQVDV